MDLSAIKEMSTVDLVMEIEGGETDDLWEDFTVEKAQTILDKVSVFRNSQGFYTRLCEGLESYIARGGEDEE